MPKVNGLDRTAKQGLCDAVKGKSIPTIRKYL